MSHSIKELKKYINKENFKKIFILCGKKSFVSSGANVLFSKNNNKKTKFFFKKSELPVLEELVEIIKSLRLYKPDLILAIGGGAVMDYAKIANVIELRPDLSELIVNYNYPFKHIKYR